MTIRDGVKHGSPAVLSGGVDVSHGKVLGERTLPRNSPDLKEGAEHIEPPTTQVKSQNLKVSKFPRQAYVVVCSSTTLCLQIAIWAVNNVKGHQANVLCATIFFPGMTGREKLTPRRFVT